MLADGRKRGLADPSHFAGFRLEDGRLSSVLLRHHGLHIDLRIDREHPVGKAHPAGVYDVVLESAVTTIQDCEDSVSAVDAEDKVLVYRNWLGIMKGTLTATVDKDGRALTRKLNEDLTYQDPSGEALTLPGRSLLLVRNVGIHMYTDAVTTTDGEPIPEGFLDALITSWGRPPRPPQQQPHTQQLCGQRLHREAQIARARGGYRPRWSCSAGSSRLWECRSGLLRSASWTKNAGRRST